MFALFLVTLLTSLSQETCPLQKSAVENFNNVNFTYAYVNSTYNEEVSTYFDTYELAIQDDSPFVLTCHNDNHVFVNSVRAVDDVNITSLDSSGEITGTCTVNNMIPNVFVTDRVDNDYNDGTRKFYCSRGCNPLKAAGQTITYPSELLGNEANSPPIHISNSTVTVTCANKYAQAVKDSGYTSIKCTEGGSGDSAWSHKVSELIKCVNGCKDVTAIDNGYTRATVTGTGSTDPPFTIGDIIPFNCNDGYVLVGYETITCTSDYQWSDNPPECVQYSLASSAQPSCFTVNGIMNLVVVSLVKLCFMY